MRILLTCLSLAYAGALLIISHAERQQEAALDALSDYKLKPQSVASRPLPDPVSLDHDPRGVRD